MQAKLKQQITNRYSKIWLQPLLTYNLQTFYKSFTTCIQHVLGESDEGNGAVLSNYNVSKGPTLGIKWPNSLANLPKFITNILEPKHSSKIEEHHRHQTD